MSHRTLAALLCVAGAGLLQQPARQPPRPSTAPQNQTIVVYKSPT